MTDIKYLDPSKIETIEQYASSLFIGLHQLMSLANVHIQASKTGLLTPVEEETVKSAVWELQRTMALYRSILEKILEKTPLTEEDLQASLGKVMTPVEKKEKVKRKKKSES